MDPVDHVIIGSGINGLVAAALLTAKGRRVIVLEKSDRPGGCMRTEEVTLPGYRHDVMAATFVLFLTSPAYAALAKGLAEQGLEFCHTPHPTAVLRPDGSSAVLTTDRAANIAALNGFAPGDGDRYARDVGGIEADAPFLFGLLGGQLWSGSTARMVGKRAWKQGLHPTAEWFGRALAPARGWLEQYASPEAQALFAPWVLHCGLTPESAYSAQMGKVVAFALEAAGAPVVKGGSGAAAEALVRLIEAQGGEVRLGTEAVKIETVGGRARGVVLADGTLIEAKSTVASVPPSALYGGLLDHPPEDAVAATKAFRHGRGDMQIHYALGAPPEWATRDLDQVALIHLSDGIDAVSKSANEAERGMLPETPTICVGQPSRLDPSRCPEGKAILWLQIPDAPRVIKGDAKGEINTTAVWSERTRELFADRIEAILARHIGNWNAIKGKRRVYSPRDLEALNPNLVGGDPYGGACSIDQFFLWRPFPGSKNHQTAIRDLWHIGASTHPGPGLGGGSGFLAAKALGA